MEHPEDTAAGLTKPVEQYNLITEKDEKHPMRPFDRWEVKAYYTDDDKVIITGVYSVVGIYWLSVTEIREQETIRRIFDYVSALKPTGWASLRNTIGRSLYSEPALIRLYHNTPKQADDIFAYYQRIQDSILEQEQGGKYYDLRKYNLVTPDDAYPATYMPCAEHSLIKVTYADDGDIIITGVADNNFIHWFSVTKIDDIGTNSKIIEWLSFCVPTVLAFHSAVLRKTKYTYEQMQSFYSAEVHTAEDILRQKKNAEAKSRTPDGDGQLIQTMKHWNKTLSVGRLDPEKAYRKHQKLIEEIQAKSFLRCSDNPEVRELYNQASQLCSDIYNGYMTAMH